jgi:hypothetical protein
VSAPRGRCGSTRRRRQLISENPYRLARDIRGIGFRTADQIAAKLGIEKTALIRVRAGISFALAEAMDDGHCGLPAVEIILLAQKLLDVPPDLVETALVLELQDGTVVACTLLKAEVVEYREECPRCEHAGLVGPNSRDPKLGQIQAEGGISLPQMGVWEPRETASERNFRR